MTPTNPQTDLYGNISEIRDTLDALLKRGKPASVEDLKVLMASVEAKSRPTYNLSAKEVAAILVPELLPLLPTPDNLAQAGQQSAAGMEAAIKAGRAGMEAAIKAGTAASVQQLLGVMQHLVASVQECARQSTASAAEYRSATAAAPRSLPVSFTDGWRWPVGLIAVSVVVTLLISWSGGAFRGVSQVNYKLVYDQAKKSTNERDEYREQVRNFRQEMSKGKDARVTTRA